MARFRLALVFGLVALASLALAGSVSAKRGYTEEPYDSLASSAKKVKVSAVRVEKPLPDRLGAPRACDFIESIRWRHRKGPNKPRKADFVVIAIPGFLGGAGSFDQLARNTVLEAKRDGKLAEFVALDRRANCLEDDHGIHAAAAAGDPQLAYDYYWGGEEVDGKTFGGFETALTANFVGAFGLERTVRDWNTVVKHLMPGRKRRTKRLLCGGHSLGGPLTAAYSSWDFDGDPSTKKDAGFKQCAGLFGLDTTLELAGGGGSQGASSLGLIGSLIEASPAPFLDVTPLTPETIQLTAAFGVGAFFRPDGQELIENLPNSVNIVGANRLLFSRDAAQAAGAPPAIQDFDLTNQTVLGGVFDDNSANALSFIRASIGAPAPGPPLVDKNFPIPSDGTFVLPDDPAAGQYAWDDYDRVGKNGRPLPLNGGGDPFTSRESEVSDIDDFARTFFEGPSNFIEQYFPTRIIIDVAAAETGAFEQLAHDGPSKRSVLLIQAGDSDANSAADEGPPIEGEAPNGKPLSGEVILPGYNHLDVLSAARKQNDGRVEPASATLADWARKVVKQRRSKPRGNGGR